MTDEFIAKLRECFADKVVYKDLKTSAYLTALGLPSFLRDWLLQSFSDAEGVHDERRINEFKRRFLPKKDEWVAIKSRIVTELENVKLLAKVVIDVDIATGELSFALPEFGLSSKDTIIDQRVWEDHRDELTSGREVWGKIGLGYRPPDDTVKPKRKGKIRLTHFENFCPNPINQDALDYFKEARRQFSTEEWLDVILGAVDYNADGYVGSDYVSEIEQKLTMVTRLLPFIEKRLNLIELAPKGTGKSYLFGRVSRYGWLSSGGVMSRAKMFYDLSQKSVGLVGSYDFVTLDEVQTISFTDVDEMRAALKGYLESGTYTVGNFKGAAECGVVLCGNVSKEAMDADGNQDMFQELPYVFHESALIERFHGFIRGWNIPRMTEDLKVCGWALNCDYFCTVMHAMRDDEHFRKIVDDLIIVPKNSDTRDTEAIKRISTAYLKLLFPHVQSAEEVDRDEFIRFCFHRAERMRRMIKTQLSIIDSEYRGIHMPKLEVRDLQDSEDEYGEI